MNKPANKQPRLKNPPNVSARNTVTRKPIKSKAKPFSLPTRQAMMLLTVEILGLVVVALFALITLIGYAAHWLSGTKFFANLLPFAVSLLAFILILAVGLIGWVKLRSLLNRQSPWLIPIFAICMAFSSCWFGGQAAFTQAFGDFRLLLGGKYEASRVTLTHQVYAAYRRYEPSQLEQLMQRSQPYQAAIAEASDRFAIDLNLLQGIAATESSFLPRDSLDGGHGLFQITRVPKNVIANAAKRLKVTKLALDNPRHNAYLAAATLAYYLEEMHGDLFLGLLAYNIGPENGGLRFIMQKYGVTDFITIQPYLQRLPRDYPIRVLAYALAFRLWQKTGRIPAYEIGKNALLIQQIGVPGLQAEGF